MFEETPFFVRETVTSSLFPEFEKNLPSAKTVLAAIEHIAASEPRRSLQAGRNYYTLGHLPKQIEKYFGSRRIFSLDQISQELGMSSSTVRGLLRGNDISENMLFRLHNYFRFQSVAEDVGENLAEPVLQMKWRSTASEVVQEKISSVASSLTALLHLVETSNSLGNPNSVVGDLERRQLIAILESALAMLKAPAVNVQEASGFFGWLRRISRRGVEKGLENQIRNATEAASVEGIELLGELVKNQGANQIDKFF